jgi:hypothetical protein
MLLLPDQSGELIMQYVFMKFYAANGGTIKKHIGIYNILQWTDGNVEGEWSKGLYRK